MNQETQDRVRVELGPRSYDILIAEDALARAGELIKPHIARPKTAIVADATVWETHGASLRQSLDAAGIEHAPIMVSPGETSKSFAELERLCDELLRLGIERRDAVLAFGGGVVGDLVGFAAAILRRGCGFIQIPTTLLAQVDSSVGGKTAINAARGKNLIGAFYQPRLVLADTKVLNTLDERELKAGYAEVVKYGLLGDAAFFEWLETNGEAVLAGEPDARRKAIRRCCEMKAEIVGEDETEAGRRALLNLGHTFGHALEAAVCYGDRLRHGEAVALGMVLAFEFSAARGICGGEDVARARAHIRAVGLPAAPEDLPGPKFNADELLEHMGQDKKNEGGRIVLILTRGVGDAFVARDVEREDVRAFLQERFTG